MLGYHDKPCGLLNLYGYFDPLLAFLDHAQGQGFVRPQPQSGDPKDQERQPEQARTGDQPEETNPARMTPQQALRLLDAFIRCGLPHFGTYQDAMTLASGSLDTTRITPDR